MIWSSSILLQRSQMCVVCCVLPNFMFASSQSSVEFSGSADRMALFSVWPNPRWWLGKFKWPYLHSGSYSSDSLHVWFCRGTVQCVTVWLCTEQAKPNTTETLDSNTSGSCKWSSTLVFIVYYISWLKYNLYHIVIDGSTTAVPVDFHLPPDVAVFIMHLMPYLVKSCTCL